MNNGPVSPVEALWLAALYGSQAIVPQSDKGWVMSDRRARSESESGRAPAPTAAPPFDPEQSLALADLNKESREPLTPENLAARQMRDATARPRPTVEDLRADGRFEVTELRAPGPPGGPDVTLVSARPSGLVGPLPLLYYMHGGAMVMGNAWSVLPGFFASGRYRWTWP